MAGIGASVLLLLAAEPDWIRAPLDEVVVEAQAYLCTGKSDGENGASFYVILAHDEKRRMIDISLVRRGVSESALLQNPLRSVDTRGDDRIGAFRLTAGGVGSGHRVELELVTRWEGAERSAEIAVDWDGRKYRTPCRPIVLPSKYR